MARESPSGAQTVERAISLLTAFEQTKGELRVSELVEITGLGQSTVSRLLATLEAAGFVSRDSRSGLYRIGDRLVGLAALALNQILVHREARQVAQSLACELGLGANVAELDGDAMRYLCHFEGALAPRSFTMIGHRSPLHATAMGKAVLSSLSRAEVERLLPEGDLVSYTPHTLTSHEALHESLDVIRSRGYATEIEELAFGRACIAAPIRDRGGNAVAALSVSGPLSALNLNQRQHELALNVIERADTVSVALGYVASSTPAALSG